MDLRSIIINQFIFVYSNHNHTYISVDQHTQMSSDEMYPGLRSLMTDINMNELWEIIACIDDVVRDQEIQEATQILLNAFHYTNEYLIQLCVSIRSTYAQTNDNAMVFIISCHFLIFCI